MQDSSSLIHLGVIESEPILRAAWERLLRSFGNCWVAGSFASFADFFMKANGYPFDVFLIRLEDTWPSGWNVLNSLKEQRPEARVVIMTSPTGSRFAGEAIQNGARAVVSTAAEPNELRDAIRAAAAGETFLCQISQQTASSLSPPQKSDRRDMLSLREANVLSLTARGMRLKEISEHMGITIKTTYSYRLRAMQKLGLRNTAEMIRYAIEEGWLNGIGSIERVNKASPAVEEPPPPTG